MPEPVIRIENLSKQYRLGNLGTGTLSHDLRRWWTMNILRKEDPYLKIGETNDRTISGGSDLVWALKDINLDIYEGEVLGIIGKNGAGKSTLLKILSKVTSPTTGSIKIKGRIASLLEVGTGFHPEMTGRENIFMNGAIMGMTKAEIRRKFDEIVDFAGVERYIDTPVKRYSSGMTVRLGFAVAAHLEPEILVVDEVLAVGDAEFQKKALGKMQDVSRNQGRTVLFVSHNMAAVQQLCSKLAILFNGQVEYIGETYKGIDKYLQQSSSGYEKDLHHQISKLSDDNVIKLRDVIIMQSGKTTESYKTNEPIEVIFKYTILKEVSSLRIGFDIISSKTGIILFRSFHDDNSKHLNSILPGDYITNATLPADLFHQDEYILDLSIGIHNERWIINDMIKSKLDFTNIDGINKLYFNDYRPGLINPFINWKTKRIIK